MAKLCLKIASVVLILVVVLYWAPALLPGENDTISPAAEDTGASDDILTITTYYVGTGYDEGHMITFPDGTTMSVDCADGDITTKSHFHDDHCATCGAGYYNRDNVAPGEVIYSDDDRNLTVTVVAANGRVIGQERVESNCRNDENPLSLALWVRYRGFDYLTTGDLYGSVEQPLGIALKERGIHVDVLKVSHHGTGTNLTSSLDYLGDIAPEYATISGKATDPLSGDGTTIPNLIDVGVKTIYCIPDYKLPTPVPTEVCTVNGTLTIATDGYTFTFSGPGFTHGPFPMDDGPTPTPTETPTDTPTWDPSVPTHTPTATPTLRPEGPWPMFRYDAAGTGQSCYFTGPETGRLEWSYLTDGYVKSNPVVGFDGRVYVGSNDNNLYAFTSDGTLIWSYRTGHYITSAAALDSAWTVYVGSYDDGFYALTSSGSILWSYITGGGIRSSAVIDSAAGKIYVGSDDNVIYAFSPDGLLEWSYGTRGNVSSSPVVGSDGNVYTGSEDNVFYALRPEGALIWSYSIGYSPFDWGTVASSPVIRPDGSICVGSGDGRIYAFSSTGSFLWRYATTKNYPVASPVIDCLGNVYAGSTNGRFYGLTPSGKCKWSYWTNSVYSSAAIDAAGNIYASTYFYGAYAFTSTGRLMWSYRTGYLMRSSPAIGSDGYVYLGSYDTRLYAFKDPPTPTPTPTATPTITPTPTMTFTPTPTPTRTSTPRPAENVLSSAALRLGDRLDIRFMLHESIERPFTALAIIIMPSGKMLNVRTLDAPVKPVVENVPRLSAPFSCQLLSTTVPKGAPKGVYQVITAFFDPSMPTRSRTDAFLEAGASFTIE